MLCGIISPCTIVIIELEIRIVSIRRISAFSNYFYLLLQKAKIAFDLEDIPSKFPSTLRILHEFSISSILYFKY